MKVSIILPTYNEAENIIGLIYSIFEHVPEKWDYEIIVIDDNSPDRTYDVVCNEFGKNSRIKPIKRTVGRGLANSIRTGIEGATGSQLLVMDTDLTHDPAEIPKLLHVGEVYDLVSGSRFCAGGIMQDTWHYVASLVFNWLIRLVLRTQIQDNLGGFFTIKRDKLRSLPYDLIFWGYGDYFFRLLHFAQKSRLSIVEVPAKYMARKGGISKSNFLKLLLTYTREMIKLKLAIWGF